MNESLHIFCDGGSRGNPGPAAIGFIVKNSQGQILVQKGKPIGQTTNNVAEYSAVIEALKWLRINSTNSIDSINFYLDSNLVVNQLNGIYKIKNSNLRNLVLKVRYLEKLLDVGISYSHISREENKAADSLVKQVFKEL